MQTPFDPYNINFNGHKLDPYRVIDIFKITFPPIQQIIKKALRCGKKHKSTIEDLREIISSAQRAIEMIEENERWENQPELPFAEVSGE